MTTAAASQPSILNAPEHSRPSADLVERFRDVPAANIGDAQERLWVMHGNIGPMWAGARCLGPALPLYTQAGDNLVIHRALETAKPGDILVVNGQGDETRALIGGLIAVRAQRMGLAGIVIDGAVRDVEEFAEIGLPVFARAITPAGPYKNGPGEIGYPVACGGVVCSPGDIVCGDGDGVVIVRQERAELVADAVLEVMAKEKDMLEKWSQ